MAELMGMKEQFVKEQERKGMGEAVFGKDRKPKKYKFKAMKDDGETSLHPARFVGLPRAEPKAYWDQVPQAARDIYRHLPLQHLGVEGMAEATIVKMHNRRVPIDLEGLLKDCRDCKQVQLAIFNFVAVLHSLHPVDYSGMVILRVLMEAAWAENLGGEKQRVTVMKRFFEEIVRDNSGRAVRKEPPLDYEQARAKWIRVVASCCPQVNSFQYGQLGQPVAVAAAAGGRAEGAAAKVDAAGKGQGNGGKGGGSGAGFQRAPARFNGVPVCFQYNSKEGCKRKAHGSMACVVGSNVYAHVCNWLFKGVGNQPDRH
jgi:hypothetical protein